MKLNSKIYVAGHGGLVGSAIMRKLQSDGYHQIITRNFSELDLRNQNAVLSFFEKERPEFVFLSAAKVGGIKANMNHKAEFIYDNLMIQTNIIHASYIYGVKKLLFLGSSCIYPRASLQPIREEYLMSGALEETNDAYAIAKIAGIKMCQSYNQQYGVQFISAMPTNLYGPFDNFDMNSSHVLPALIKKFMHAHEQAIDHVILWGTGKPYREFLYVDDLADACLFLMKNYDENLPINVGTGIDISIYDLAQLIKEIIGYQGEIICDSSMPDGTPKKLLNVSKINALGWQASTSLEEGIRKTIAWLQSPTILNKHKESRYEV